MRAIEWTSQFKRDYKREGKGQHRAALTLICSRWWKRWQTINCWNLGSVTMR
jgi:hypothetical protein